jgi:hypothetical protein
MNADPGSLENLHDLVMPVPAPWWPPAPGWIIVSAALIMVLGRWLIRAIRHGQSNRYRREALVLLGKMDDAETELPTLIKRVALSAYPRERVASLTGEQWLAFLDQTGHTDAFTTGAGRWVARLAYNQHWPPRFRRLNLTARGLLFAPGFCGISPKKLLRDYPGSSMAARAAAAAVAGESPASALSRIPERADCTVP